MTLEARAIAYLTKMYGCRIYTAPEKHEPGFYKFVQSRHGSYYSKVAHDVAEQGAYAGWLIDVTGDSDKLLVNLK